MKHLLPIVLATMGMALPFAFAQATPALAQAEGACLNKREIQQRIDSGELRQLSDAMQSAAVDGKIISSAAKVCVVNGQLHWRINVMDSYGESKPVILPAE